MYKKLTFKTKNYICLNIYYDYKNKVAKYFYIISKNKIISWWNKIDISQKRPEHCKKVKLIYYAYGNGFTLHNTNTAVFYYYYENVPF